MFLFASCVRSLHELSRSAFPASSSCRLIMSVVMSSTSPRSSPVVYENTNGQKDYEDSSDEEPEVRMRVGEMFQAKVLPWDPSSEKLDAPEGMRIWTPSHTLPDEKIEEYCRLAKEKHGYNIEQTLGMLFWHKHDIDRALKDMSNFTPMPDDWSVEDKVLFEQAYTFHGKSFRRIQQLLPDKEIGQLVKYYYAWKKTRTKTSLLDRHAQKFSKAAGNASDESDEGNHTTYLQGKSHEMKLMPVKTEHHKDDDSEIKHKLPKGICLDLKSLTEISNYPGGSEKYLKKLETEICEVKSKIQLDKQHWGTLCNQLNGISQFDIILSSSAGEEKEQTPIWSQEELLLAVQGVRRYGKDFQAISEVLGTKTAAQVKIFFVSQRRRFNLDQVLQEYEDAEAGNREVMHDRNGESTAVNNE